MVSEGRKRQDLIPASLIYELVSELNWGAEAARRWGGDQAGLTLARVSDYLRAVLENPLHCWVTTSEAARVLGKSEETIRRWCRQNTTLFRFRRDELSGRYEVWLADLHKTEVPDAT